MSVLAAARPFDVVADRFCHLIVLSALPAERYRDLAASFPCSATILDGHAPHIGNAAVRLPAIKVLDNPAIAANWRGFFDFHTSDRFWADILRVFGSARRRGAPGDFDVRLDCQFVINTPWPQTRGRAPAVKPPSVKTPHVDKRDTIFSVLVYFRDPDDKGEGGDLEFYAWTRSPRFLRHRMIMPDDVQYRKGVAYAANTLVAFVNSAQAAHGVTPRAASQLPRRYINLIAATPFAAFATPKLGTIGTLIHWRRRRGLGWRVIGDLY